MNQMTKTEELLQTNVDVEPVGVIYNLTANVIEKAITEYLIERGIKDTLAVRLRVDQLRNRTEVSVFAFFDKNSSNITSNMNKIPEYLRNRVQSGALKPSEKLQEVLRGLTSDTSLAVDKDIAYVRLNIFKCLGLVLHANPRNQEILINEIKQGNKKDDFIILSVIKKVRYRSNFNNPEDKFSRILDRA